VSLESLDTVLQLAFLYGVSAVAVALAFRIVGFPDLTPDGSFVFGAATAGVLALRGVSPVVSVLVAAGAGGVAGLVTAVLHTRLGISRLLSGILVMLALYSLSLRVMGTSNLSLLDVENFLTSLQRQGGLVPAISTFAVCGVAFLGVTLLLSTKVGLLLRATGDSESVLELRGYSREPYQLFGLAVANGLAAGSGAIIALYQGFVDISMGTGLVVTCLTAIVMGETILRPERVVSLMAAPVVGMLMYQTVLSIALRVGFRPADLRLSTAVLALAFIAVDRLRTHHGRIGHQIGNRAF
jgi:putative tryptophan/tyrosine transport system permease protein